MTTDKYFRDNIAAMTGYVPGEQPKNQTFIKLNTNENPYPPSPKVIEAIKGFDFDKLRRYTLPASDDIREAAAQVFGFESSQIIAGNGSDDILTILFRSFAGEGEKIAWLNPSYSLYPILAQIQGAEALPVELNDDFSIPDDVVEQLGDAKLFVITRPNAPTSTSHEKQMIEKICREFSGVVVIDEAYGDFADDNCFDLIEKYDNIIVTRTLSKSYSLAGIRLGLAFGNTGLIGGLHKVRDSYNVNFLTQAAATAALLDQEYFKECTNKILLSRQLLNDELCELGFNILPSQTNFLFAEPPMNAAEMNEKLREKGFLVRYFSDPRVSKYLRVTIGTEEENQAFIKAVKEILSCV